MVALRANVAGSDPSVPFPGVLNFGRAWGRLHFTLVSGLMALFQAVEVILANLSCHRCCFGEGSGGMQPFQPKKEEETIPDASVQVLAQPHWKHVESKAV